jgi:hypothetical protein
VRRKPSQFVTARLIPMLHYYKSRIPKKYREYKTTVFLSVAATCSIAILSCEYQCILIHIDVSPSIERIRSDVD